MVRRVPLLVGWPGGAQISAPRSDFPTEEEGKRRVGMGRAAREKEREDGYGEEGKKGIEATENEGYQEERKTI